MSRESVRDALQELAAMTVRFLWTCPHGEGFLSYPKARGTHHPDILSMQYLPPPSARAWSLSPVPNPNPESISPPLPLLPPGPCQPA